MIIIVDDRKYDSTGQYTGQIAAHGGGVCLNLYPEPWEIDIVDKPGERKNHDTLRAKPPPKLIAHDSSGGEADG